MNAELREIVIDKYGKLAHIDISADLKMFNNLLKIPAQAALR